MLSFTENILFLNYISIVERFINHFLKRCVLEDSQPLDRQTSILVKKLK
nr:MAG TPA: hypothetical protein [Caudoviricetes sp.]